MNELCDKCGGKCCVGIIEVTHDDVLHSDALLTEVGPAPWRYRVMRTTSSGRCVAQGQNGRCEVYDRRPSVCRRFEAGGTCCEAFREGKVVVHACEPCRLFEDELVTPG
jgi:Fe-S-cluster containining protein